MDQKPAPVVAKPAAAAPASQAAPIQLPPRVADVFRRLLAGAMKLLYSSPETAQSIVKMVASAPSPVEGIVSATQVIVGQVEAKAKGVSPDILKRLRAPVAVLIAELCVTAGVVKDDPRLVPAVVAHLKSPAAQPGAKAAPQAPAPEQQQPQPGIVAGAQQQAEGEGA